MAGIRAAVDRLNTHAVASSGALTLAASLAAIVAVGMQPAVDDHLIGHGFAVEALRGTYDAFVRYAALPTIVTLVAAGGLATYFGRPKNVPSGPAADTHDDASH